MWLFHVRFFCRIRPGYFVVSLYLSMFDPIFTLLSKFTGKHFPLGLKIQQLDFLGLKFIVSLFAIIHFCSLFSSLSTKFSGELKSLSDMKRFVSSANSFIVISLSDLWMSFMSNRNSIGPRTDPCGTPYSHRSEMSDCVLFVTRNCFLLDKYDSSY